MESKAWSITYTQAGKRYTAVLYGPTAEAIAEDFGRVFHPSKALEAVAPLDWTPVRPRPTFPLIP